jgi:hypothetical protein
MRVPATAVAGIALVSACASTTATHKPSSGAEISVPELQRYISVLASDSMRGRNTPSLELDRAAAFVAVQLRGAGLRPAGESYLRPYMLRSTVYDTAHARVSIEGGPTWTWRKDMLPRGAATPAAGVSGTAVLIAGPPPYESLLRGRDLRGKVAFLLLPQTRTSFGPDWVALTNLLKGDQRPAALVLVTEKSDTLWNTIAGRLTVPSRKLASDSTSGIPTFEVSAQMALPVLRQHGISPAESWGATAARLLDLPQLRLTGASPRRVLGTEQAPNVVAVLEGSDPVLRNEYVVLSAHLDHVGVSADAASGDSIFNGADDNASGCAALLAVARRLAAASTRPARSIVFLFTTGEETGMWGSQSFVDAPPFPVSQIVANINADMIGRNAPDSLSALGMEYSTLGEVVRRVVSEQPELGLTVTGDLWPGQNFFHRSDQIWFARRGVPALQLFTGPHPEYHQPTDEVERIDFEKLVRVSNLIRHLATSIANAPARPTWDPAARESFATAR